MSKAIKFNDIHHLVPGAVIFHIIGSGSRNIKTINDITEVKITRSPYNQPFAGSTAEVLWMDGITTYTTLSGGKITGLNRARSRSLRDGGISRDGRVYNLNRYFWTKEDAEEFIQELNSGVFSDPIDQQEYDHELNYRDEWSW